VELVEVDNNFAVLKDDKGNVLFTLINPYSMKKDYNFEIPSDVKVLLDLDKTKGVLVYNNVVMKEPITEAIVNFKAPFLFNPENQTCAQIILEDEKFAKLGDFVRNEEDK
jgi:flagellar assembly factor FliW